MDETTKAYIAGILDGEGSIGIYITRSGQGYGTHSLQITVKMADREAVELISELYKARISIQGVRGNSRPCGAVIIRSLKAVQMLLDCLPYMLVKKKQAEIGLAFMQAKTDFMRVGRKHIPRGTIRMSKAEWDVREAYRIQMYALNSGRLGFRPKPLLAAAETEWEGRLPQQAQATVRPA